MYPGDVASFGQRGDEARVGDAPPLRGDRARRGVRSAHGRPLEDAQLGLHLRRGKVT